MESARNRPFDENTLQQFLIKKGKNEMNKDYQEEFENHLGIMARGRISMSDPHMPWDVKLEHIEAAKKAHMTCKEFFKDEANNLHRWLYTSTCVFKSPITDGYIEVFINGSEQLFEFLSFCKKQNTNEYDELYFDYLEHLILYSEID